MTGDNELTQSVYTILSGRASRVRHQVNGHSACFEAPADSLQVTCQRVSTHGNWETKYEIILNLEDSHHA